MNHILNKTHSLLIDGSHRSWAIWRSLTHMSPGASPLLVHKGDSKPGFIHIPNTRHMQGNVPDRYFGYKKKFEQMSTKDQIMHGLGMMKGELKMWKDEWKEHLDADPVLVYRPCNLNTDLSINLRLRLRLYINIYVICS